MKKFIYKLLAFLMVLIMLFDAAPVASLAEALDSDGQASGQADAQQKDDTPIVTDAAEGKKLDITLPTQPTIEESHILTAGEYSVIPVDNT